MGTGNSRIWPALRLPVPSPEEILARSAGEVTSPETLDFRRLEPVPGGLFCPRLFGPHGQRDPGAWAHIELPCRLIHPEWWVGAPSRLAVLLGLPQRTVERLVRREPERLETLLDTLDAPGLSGDLRSRLETARGAVPRPRSLLGRLELVEAVAGGESPLLPPCFPVLPAARRDYTLLPGGKIRWRHVNDLYRRLVNRVQRLRRLREAGAPDEILRRERAAMQLAMDMLCVNRLLRRPALDADGHAMHSLIDLEPPAT
jgi:DNA-directed RNA polymerase subunit beta'